jgi:hypothetical protein
MKWTGNTHIEGHNSILFPTDFLIKGRTHKKKLIEFMVRLGNSSFLNFLKFCLYLILSQLSLSPPVAYTTLLFHWCLIYLFFLITKIDC